MTPETLKALLEAAREWRDARAESSVELNGYESALMSYLSAIEAADPEFTTTRALLSPEREADAAVGATVREFAKRAGLQPWSISWSQDNPYGFYEVYITGDTEGHANLLLEAIAAALGESHD